MSMMSAFQLLRDGLRAFRSESRGNVTITFALAMLPILGFVGAAVDYSRANSAKASMQGALDAAALTLSKEAQGLNQNALNSKADAYFKANFNRPEVKNIVVTPTFTDLGSGSFKLNLIGKATIHTTITGIWQDKLNIGADSQVIWGYKKLELALALDNTGSMLSANKMTHLKTAAKNLIATLKTASKSPGDIKIAIIPFDTTVNLGTSYKNNNWFDIDSIDCNGWKAGSGCNSSNWKDYWEGCVRDRSYPYDGNDDAPTSSGKKFPVYDCGSLVTLMPLTYDWTALNSKIDAMQPNGMTNVTIGLAWAYHALTPGAPLAEASAPKTDLDKVIVLLTDGENTESWKNQNNTDGLHAKPDRRADQACLRQRQAGRDQALHNPRDRRECRPAVEMRDQLDHVLRRAGCRSAQHGVQDHRVEPGQPASVAVTTPDTRIFEAGSGNGARLDRICEQF